jgi:hypothetical protein
MEGISKLVWPIGFVKYSRFHVFPIPAVSFDSKNIGVTPPYCVIFFAGILSRFRCVLLKYCTMKNVRKFSNTES